MKQLIEALQILITYGNPPYPTTCEHDILYIVGIEPKDISKYDRDKLEELGFTVKVEGEWDEDNKEEVEESRIYSYKYGSA